MIADDKFSKWMGLQVEAVGDGYAKLVCTIREEMLNGVGSVHGGVTFALADSAFAFACNSDNNLSVALDVHINFTKAGQAGDVFTVEARRITAGKKTGVYDVRITNQHNQLVAIFKGTCFRTGKEVVSEL